MKVKSEDILKPGAALKVEKIDFNDPEVKRIIGTPRKKHRKNQKYYDNLRKVITI